MCPVWPTVSLSTRPRHRLTASERAPPPPGCNRLCGANDGQRSDDPCGDSQTTTYCRSFTTRLPRHRSPPRTHAHDTPPTPPLTTRPPPPPRQVLYGIQSTGWGNGDLVEITDIVAAGVFEEMDYRNEAVNAKRFERSLDFLGCGATPAAATHRRPRLPSSDRAHDNHRSGTMSRRRPARPPRTPRVPRPTRPRHARRYVSVPAAVPSLPPTPRVLVTEWVAGRLAEMRRSGLY